MRYQTPYGKYLSLANATVGLRDKRVLEVGGCTPPHLVSEYQPSAWVCIDLDGKAVSAFNGEAREFGLMRYHAFESDIADLDEKDSYDVVFSINAFEHIHSLDQVLQKIWLALREGGHLFTLFGPIWSSDVGHHLSLPLDEGELHFFDGILEPWEHLSTKPEEIYNKLMIKYGENKARDAVHCIFEHPALNRLYDHDYISLFKSSPFCPILLLRNKKGKAPPNIPGATNTREFLVIMKKGTATMFERVSCFLSFALAYLYIIRSRWFHE